MTDTPPIREHAAPDASGAWRLALQEKLLMGTDDEKLAQAADLGVAGIEFNAAGLAGRVDSLSAALADAPVQAATVRLGTDCDFLSPDEPTRQQALDALRYTMTDAVDIGADGVVLVPHSGPLNLPDLMPLKAPIQIAVELMTLHLRSLSDLAYVFGIKLYLHPLRPAETGFLNMLSQGVELRRRIKFHPHVLLAADAYHTPHLDDETAPSVGHVYLTDADGRLPDDGAPSSAWRGALQDTSGWAVLTNYNQTAAPSQQKLSAALEKARSQGF